MRIILQVVINIIMVPLLPLLISTRWDWWEAWFLAGLFILGFVISRVLVRRRHPQLIAERSDFLKQPGVKPWDKILVPLLSLGGALVMVYAGLDDLYHFSAPVGLWVRLAGMLVVTLGYALSSYALVENAFFSAAVRIQTERGQTVVSTGPYRWVRHPGYLGGILVYVGVPLLLGSVLALLPALFLLVTLVYRTRMEDMVLQDELQGYRDYASRVRYRLLPPLW